MSSSENVPLEAEKPKNSTNTGEKEKNSPLTVQRLVGIPHENFLALQQTLAAGKKAMIYDKMGKADEVIQRNGKLYEKRTGYELIDISQYQQSTPEMKVEIVSTFMKLVKAYGSPVWQNGPIHIFIARVGGSTRKIFYSALSDSIFADYVVVPGEEN